jgi:hypothetical protein
MESHFLLGFLLNPAAPLDVWFLGQGMASLPDSLPGAPSNMSDAGSRSSFQGASPGS